LRKNNLPFSHPIFRAPLPVPQSQNLQNSYYYFCGFAQSEAA